MNHDVASDSAKRDEMIKLSGQLGVPVIVIDGAVYSRRVLERISRIAGTVP